MVAHSVPPFTLPDALATVLVFLVFAALASLLAEPKRQQLMAILVAGASGVYFNGGLGLWEYPLAVAMLVCAYRGLVSYPLLGVGWLIHTVSDTLHHFYGTPIIALVPMSSAQCAVTDAFIAAWFFAGAPSVYGLGRKLLGQPAAR